MFRLDGKTALVTGASRGLGRGIALCLARAGADVIVNYRSSKAQAEDVAREITSLGRRATVQQADVSSEDEVKQMMAAVEAEAGHLDILVNNAGTTRAESIDEIDLDSWNHILATNLTGTYLCSRHAIPLMKTRGWGRIVQVSSVVGENGALYGHVHYAASKSGQLGFTKTLARTVAPFGITVNAIAPGIIATELLYQTHGEEKVGALAESVPMGLGTVEDVGCAIVYLASEEARYITGATLDINGGMYLR